MPGAKIDALQAKVSVYADANGQFRIEHLPPGEQRLQATYAGLDAGAATVLVPAGGQVTYAFALSSGIYQLDPYKVPGEREGEAAAITAMRNADNVKEVAAMDSYGNLPNMNATELAMRLPGVSFADPGDEVVEQIGVRGAGPGMTTITIDGALMSSFSAQARTTRMTAFNGVMFDSIEVIKGHTPDRSADSLGGTINFKTRSPLAMQDKRRIDTSFSVTDAPTFTEQIPLRRAHPFHPLFVTSYQEKFKVFGSEADNLGVFVNAFYSENAFGYFHTQRDYQQTNATPAYLWDYRTQDDYNNRMQWSLNTKFDYRFSPRSHLTLNLIYNDAPEPMRRQYQTRAFTGSQTTNPSSTTGIVPGGFTDRVTTVRDVPTPSSATYNSTPAAAIDVLSTLINRVQRLRHADLGGEHDLGWMEVDWSAVWSRTRYRTLGREGTLTNRIGGIPFVGPNGGPGSPSNNVKGPNGQTGVGWILDRTPSVLYPLFLQNGGLDFTDPDNYRPTVNGLTSNAGDLQEHIVRDYHADLKFPVPTPWDAMTLKFQTGAEVRDQAVTLTQNRRRWSYLGTTALPTDPGIILWDQVKTHRDIPQWEAAQFVRQGEPTDPSLWQEDQYFHDQTLFSGYNWTREMVTAGYAMVQGRFANNGFLAGVRGEKTDTAAASYTRNQVTTTAAQQVADPMGSAITDYGHNYRLTDGSYLNYFPSAHLWRDFTPNLKGRLSWSTSFARPSMASYLPSDTLNSANTIVTEGNPELKPEQSQNWDATLEYYFEPAGSFTVGYFYKTIKNYFVTADLGTIAPGADNGFDGQYSGLDLQQPQNAGAAKMAGWEFSYIQQFTFLPGLLRGLALNANFSLTEGHGTFNGGNYERTSQVAYLIPYTGNISLAWNYRKFGARVLYNYTYKSLRTAYNFTNPSRNEYMMPRELWNLGLYYNVLSNVSLGLDIANLFNAPQRYYRHIPDQLSQFYLQGTTITASIQGRF